MSKTRKLSKHMPRGVFLCSDAALQLEDELAAARSQNHQLREDEAAAQRVLQQRQDDLQRTGRWMMLRDCAAIPPHPHAAQAAC